MRLSRIVLLAALPFALTGCDSDGDGLSNSEEKELGSDPATDEVNTHGTDPTKADTDGDGYSDPDELYEGSDPTSATSMIYSGGWPYNRAKDDDFGEPSSSKASPGAEIPRFVLQDQFEEDFDIYDLSGGETPIVMDLSGLWCGWCHEMAKLIEGRPNALESNFPDVAEAMSCVPDAIESGDMYWVTVIYSGRSGADATPADRDSWASDYPNPHIPVLLDDSQEVFDWFQANGFPAMSRGMSSDMKLVTGPEVGYTDMLSDLCADM